MLLSFPLYCTIAVLYDKPFSFVLENISTLNLWYEGNPYGMWYIGLIMILYIIYPLFHMLVFKPNIRLIPMILLMITILCIPMIVGFFPDYHSKVGVATDVMPSFFIGSILGYFVRQSKKVNIILWMVATITLWILCKHISGIPHLGTLTSMGVIAQKLAFLLLLVGLFRMLQKVSNTLLLPFQYLGRYSLEIYILHLLLYNIILIIYPFNSILSTTLAVVIALTVAPVVSNIYKRILH